MERLLLVSYSDKKTLRQLFEQGSSKRIKESSKQNSYLSHKKRNDY